MEIVDLKQFQVHFRRPMSIAQLDNLYISILTSDAHCSILGVAHIASFLCWCGKFGHSS